MFFQYPFLRRLTLFFFLLNVTFVSAGCNTGLDTNETIYTSLIGIDKSENRKIRVTYQFEGLKNEGEGESDKPPSRSGLQVITIEGANFHQTVDFLTSIVSRSPSFAHVRAIVFGEEIARDGIYEYLSILLRFNEFRSSTYILVANNSTASEFIAKNKPTIVPSVSKYVETQMSLSKYSNIFLKSSIHEFYNRLKSNSAAPYAALGGVDGENAEPEQRHLSGKDDVSDIHAGEIPRKGTVNPAEIAGTALFRQDKMIGKLNSRETLIVAIFKRDFKDCIIHVDDPYAPGYQVGVKLKLTHPSDIKVLFENGKPKISVGLDFICSLTNIPSGVSYEKKEYQEQLEKIIVSYMLREIQNMLDKTQNMGADVIGFGYQARMQFRTYPVFMGVKWDELYAQAEFNVKVAAKIKNSGLMRRTTPMSQSRF